MCSCKYLCMKYISKANSFVSLFQAFQTETDSKNPLLDF